MRIISAWVDDPTTRGHLLSPQVCVEVDEAPDVTIAPETFAGGWTVGKYGPFVKYTCDAPGAVVDDGDFNVRFRSRFPVVVDITLFIEGQDKPILGMSLPLSRARQLIRKHDPKWRLLISDKAAEHGRIKWLPVQTDPGCRWWVNGSICGNRPARTVRVEGVDMPLCDDHVKKNNAIEARKRSARA